MLWFRGATAVCLGSIALIVPFSAAQAALQDEIQVYESDINEPGQFHLEIHMNGTPDGVSTPSYPGEIVSDGGVRQTFEFSYGVSRTLEAGMYVPTLIDRNGHYDLGGIKFRMKWLPVQLKSDNTGWFGGLNIELSRVRLKYSQSRYGGEARFIIGHWGKNWHETINPTLGFDFSGPDGSAEPGLELGVKIAHQIVKHLWFGPELYSEFGRASHLDPWRDQQQTAYLAIDYDTPPWQLNFGVGRGLTAATDHWTIKAVYEVPFF